MTTVLIDNFDSFTYNIYQYLCELGADVKVFRNDAITVEELVAMAPARVVVSPGPGTPADAGISKAVIEAFAGKIPVLGVCLGMQSMVELYGGDIVIGPETVHGKTSPMAHDGKGIFDAIQSPMVATRYHSLVAAEATFPHDHLDISARCAAKCDPSLSIIQAVRHKVFTMEGVQFHPESITSTGGKQLFANFLKMTKGTWK